MTQVESVAQVNSPMQARSKKALERIFQAVGKLLKVQTFDQITVAEIAKTAGVAVGSVYQRFKTKDDLLWSMYEDYLCEAEHEFKLLENSKSAQREYVFRLSDTVAKLFVGHSGVVRSLLWKYRHNPNEIPTPFLRRIESVYDAGMTYLARGAGIAVSDPRIRHAFSFIITTSREEYIFGDTRRLMGTSDNADEFKKMQCDAIIGILEA